MFTELLVSNAALVSAMMLLTWAASVALRNVGIVDIAWGARSVGTAYH